MAKQWEYIVDNNVCVPIHEIWLGNEDEPVRKLQTNFLSDHVLIDKQSFESCNPVHPQVDLSQDKIEEEVEFPDFQYTDTVLYKEPADKLLIETTGYEVDVPHEPLEEAVSEINFDSSLNSDRSLLSNSINQKLSSTLMIDGECDSDDNNDVQFNVSSEFP